MTEIWKAAPDYEGIYSVSSYGCVRQEGARRRGTWPGRILRPDTVKGYLQVTLYKNGEKRREKVHRLVLLAFRGPQPEGCEGRHLDGVRRNCHLDNLAWGTKEQNAADKAAHGTGYRPIGDLHHARKLCAVQVIDMRRRAATGESQASLCRAFGVSRALTSLIVNRKVWRHL